MHQIIRTLDLMIFEVKFLRFPVGNIFLYFNLLRNLMTKLKEVAELLTPKRQPKNTHGLCLSQERVVTKIPLRLQNRQTRNGCVQELSSQKECRPRFVKL